MNEQRREFIDSIDDRMRQVQVEMMEICVRHGCTLHHNTVDNTFRVAFHVGETAEEVMNEFRQVIDERWMLAVFDKDTMIFEKISPRLQDDLNQLQRLEKLAKILNPMEMVALMMRLQSGEDPRKLLSEYDEQLQRAEEKAQQQNEDPRALLCNFDELNEEQQKDTLDNLFGEDD